jgi:hypothetical protein
MTFKLTIEETNSRQFMEREKRYGVKVNGVPVDELYYNMKGWRGSLMTVHGERFDLGEKGISAWKKLAGTLNREAKDVLAACAADTSQLLRTQPTSDGNRLNAAFGAPGANEVEVSISRRRLASAAHLFPDCIPMAFFSEDVAPPLPRASLATAVTPNAGATWADTRYTLAFLKTTDEDWTAVITGTTPDAELFVTGRMDPAEIVIDETTSIVFLRTQTLLELTNSVPHFRIGAIRASALPGRGFASETEAFTVMVTSTSQRPEIILGEGDQWATEILARQGLRIAQPDPEVVAGGHSYFWIENTPENMGVDDDTSPGPGM